MVTGNEYKNETKAKKPFYISVGVMVFVILLNIGLYFYNNYVISVNDGFAQEISSIEENIKKINEDPSVQLYTLVTANKVYLERYRYLSNIPEFINNIKELSKNYNIKFEGFSYANGMISTLASASDDEVSLGSTKAKKFIEYFRKNDKDIFALKFIHSFEGQSTVKFNPNFLIK